MRTLAIDIETFSSADLTKTGVYKYTEAPDFEILLFAYCFSDGAVKIIDLASGETLPYEVTMALYDPYILKTAYNANFERTCITKHFGIELPPEQWECTAVKASMVGLPHGLEAVSIALKIEGKLKEGKDLIRFFSCPCKPTKTNSERTRNLPEHAPEKWQKYKEYCCHDVQTELRVREKIAFFEIPEKEARLWNLDQRINDKGFKVDRTFVGNAIKIDIATNEKLTSEAINLTGLDNPNSVKQLKEWIGKETGEEIKSLNKEIVPEILKNSDCEIVKRVLEIRQQMSKSSVKKYLAMAKAVCKDGRIRGLLQFYGANRTGRWAGRLVQIQNLPKNNLLDLDLARKLVREGDLEMIEILFGNVPDTLSQLTRTAFIPAKDCRFIVADFSAIEARVIAWLAGEKWRLDVFNSHGMIYEASASQMFKVPIEKVTKASHYRQKGKIAELALGYQGGPDALIRMGAIQMGVVDNIIADTKKDFDAGNLISDTWENIKDSVIRTELSKLVNMWRNANKKIVQYWNIIGDAVFDVVENRSERSLEHGIKIFIEKGALFIQLPSGRRLSYLKATIGINRMRMPAVVYQGVNQTTKKWEKTETYGGKLVENIVQAIARDCLAEGILRLTDANYSIVAHVHDEVILEELGPFGTTEEVDQIMSEPISWAKDLPLKAESYETNYYRKD